MFQFLRVVFTLALFIPAMWAFMYFVRPLTDAGSDWLGHKFGAGWALTIIIGTPWLLYFILKCYERPADAPPSRLDWLLKRRY